MKTTNRLVPFGMIGVLSFLLLDILGKALWPEYNPVTTYVSILTANEAPNAHLMRLFLNAYTVSFLLFSLGMTALSLKAYHKFVKTGYAAMLATAAIAAVGFGACPISMALVFSKNDIIHLIITVFMLCASIISMLLIAAGYLWQENLKPLGRVCFLAGMVYIALNIWHLLAILSGAHIVGLIQRLTFYTFHALTFVLSWAYTFRWRRFTDAK